MAADFRFVTNAAERHAHEFTTRRVGDRLAKRCLADARRPDEAEDGPLELVRPRLHGEILKDALLDLLQAIMLLVEDRLRFGDVLLDLSLDPPRDRQQPIEIVANDRRLGRHRRHLLKLLQLGKRLVLGLFRQLRVLDLFLELGDIVALVGIAEFLLNCLHLLIQIVLALRLLHLALDARTDLTLDLENGNLAFHQRIDALQPLGDACGFEHILLVGNLYGEVRCDRIGELRVILDLADVAQNLGRDLFVELHVALELRHDRTRQRLKLFLGAGNFDDAFDLGLEIVGVAV